MTNRYPDIRRIKSAYTLARGDRSMYKYLIADLRGKSTPKGAEALVALAHPKFRDEPYVRGKDIEYL